MEIVHYFLVGDCSSGRFVRMFVASDTNVTRNPAETYSLVSGLKLDEKVLYFYYY